MAITKDYATPNGVIATYHKLQHIEFSTASRILTLTFHVYYSKAAREAGAQHLYAERVEIPVTDLSQDPRNIFYPMAAEHWASFAKDGIRDDLDDKPENTDFSLSITEEAKTQPPPPPPDTVVVTEPSTNDNPI